MQYKQLYDYGREYLDEAAIDEAAVDARLLLEYICNTDRNTLYAHGEMEVESLKENQYKTLIAKRAKHIPLQHLTGVQNFMGLDFVVNEHVLIPRQDTEILVEEILRDMHDGMKILDMCTGSGCILLSILHYSNDCVGVGVDLSDEALDIAKQNAETICKDENVVFVHSDLFENVEGKFDLIVSNPPYIATKVIDGLMPEVREHEPFMALDGHEDGLYFYKRIIEESEKYLIRGGHLFFEIGYDQSEAVTELMKLHHFIDIQVKKDYAGLDRVVYGTFLGGL